MALFRLSLLAVLACAGQQALATGSTIVIDSGSSTIKVGLAVDPVPDEAPFIIPAVVGRSRVPGPTGQPYVYYGTPALALRDTLDLQYPTENGRVTDWDALEKLWRSVLTQEARLKPAEHSILVSEPPFVADEQQLSESNDNRQRLARIVFDKLNASGLFISSDVALSLWSTGRTTGVVVDIGYSSTHIVPIHKGNALYNATIRLAYGASNLIDNLQSILNHHHRHHHHHFWPVPLGDYRHSRFNNLDDRAAVRDLMETPGWCYTAFNFPKAMRKVAATQWRSARNLSLFGRRGGRILTGSERFRCVEPLFQPRLMGLALPGIHQALRKAINRSPSGIRAQLYANVLLSGGPTQFKGFAKRLRRELSFMAPRARATAITIVNAPERQSSVWKGGALFALTPAFQEGVISREQYYESGPIVVHRRLY